MVLLILTHLGVPLDHLSHMIESNGICKRINNQEYLNNLDLIIPNKSHPILYDVLVDNASLHHKNINSKILILPCRPDMVWDAYNERFGKFACSAYFNRLRRLYEIAHINNSLFVPFYNLFTVSGESSLRKYLNVGKNFKFNKLNSELKCPECNVLKKYYSIEEKMRMIIK